MSTRTIHFILAGVALVFAYAAPVSAETIQIKIDKLKFSPEQVTVHVGDTIEWVNADFIAHTATARNKAWDVMLARGKSATTAMTKAGTIDYYCRFHPNMVGKIIVQDK
jgi:plastocyanin